MGSSSKSSPPEPKPEPTADSLTPRLTAQDWQQLEGRLQALVEEARKQGDYDVNASKIRALAEILLAVVGDRLRV